MIWDKRWFQFAILMILAFIWVSSFILMKIGLLFHKTASKWVQVVGLSLGLAGATGLMLAGDGFHLGTFNSYGHVAHEQPDSSLLGRNSVICNLYHPNLCHHLGYARQ